MAFNCKPCGLERGITGITPIHISEVVKEVMAELEEVRCKRCGRLLFRGKPVEIEIKCASLDMFKL